MTGESVEIEIIIFRVECDAVGVDLRWALFLVKQFTSVDNQFCFRFGLGRFVVCQQPSRLPGFQIDHHDRAQTGLGNECHGRFGVDAHIIEIAFLRRHIFTKRDVLHDLVRS